MISPIDAKLPTDLQTLRQQGVNNIQPNEPGSFERKSSQQMSTTAQHLIEAWVDHAKKITDGAALHQFAQRYSDAIQAGYCAKPLDLLRHLEWPDDHCPALPLALLRSCALWLHLTDRLYYQQQLQQEGLSVLLLTPTAFVRSAELTVMDSQQLVKARQRWRFASYASALQWRRWHEAQQKTQPTPHPPGQSSSSATVRLPSTWRALYDMSYQSRQQSLHQIHPLSALLQWCWALALSMTPQWRQSNGQHLVNPPRQGLKQRLDKLWFDAIPLSDGLLLPQIQRLWELQPPPLSFGVLIRDDERKLLGRLDDRLSHDADESTGKALRNTREKPLLTSGQHDDSQPPQQTLAILTTEAPWLFSTSGTQLSPAMQNIPSPRVDTEFRWQVADSSYQPQVALLVSQQKSRTVERAKTWSLANVLSICRQTSIKKQVDALHSSPSMVDYICLHATALLQAEPSIRDVRHAIVSIGQDQLPAILVEAWLDQQLYQQRKPALELLLPWFKCFAFILQQLQVSQSPSNTIKQPLNDSQCRQLSLLLLQQLLQHSYWQERPAMQAWLLAQKMIRHPELWPHIQQQTAVLHFPKAWQQTLLDMANGRSSATDQSADAAWHGLNLALDILQGLWQGQLQESALAYQQFRSRFAGFELRWSDFLQEILLHSDICCRIGIDL
jgi:hypothetical protein